jgi:hypothetical protein
MDYNGIAALVWFTLLGLAILTLVVGFSVRAFLAPVIREALGHLRSEADREQQLLGVRLEQLEERLAHMETGLARLDAAEEFRHRLRAPKEGTEDQATSKADRGVSGGA